jgi:hypothetical protein
VEPISAMQADRNVTYRHLPPSDPVITLNTKHNTIFDLLLFVGGFSNLDTISVSQFQLVIASPGS